MVAGLFYSFCHPPFNHETHPVLLLFPLLSFITILPLFLFSLEEPIGKARLWSYLFGITASLTQFYWIANVVVEGLWLLILLALFLLTLFIALLYLLYGMLYRYTVKRFGSWHVLLFPALWIVIEYIRTLGDISFPWALSGYALTPLLPLAQLASITGVYGLSFIVVLGNILLWEFLRAVYKGDAVTRKSRQLVLFGILLFGLVLGGLFRIHSYRNRDEVIRISMIQNNMDQTHWNSRVSLDTSMTINEHLVYSAVKDNPDLLLFPESGVFCYLERQQRRKRQVLGWSDSINIPIILGTLHLEREVDNPYYKYKVYNSVFLLNANSREFEHYHKIKLVPFSEGLPFEGIFPLLSRMNLGESDFYRGSDETVFSIGDTLHPAPFLCYEIVYPDLVRRRVKAGADLLVNLTNDAWFGRSTAPFLHAAMARMRSIENGVSLARCANSGISMFVDPLGRILGKTKLYKRTIITEDVPSFKIYTVYCRLGDWIIWISVIIIIVAFMYPKRGGNKV